MAEIDVPHTEFTIGPNMRAVDADEEHPEEQTDNPRVPVCPELEDELRRGKV